MLFVWIAAQRFIIVHASFQAQSLNQDNTLRQPLVVHIVYPATCSLHLILPKLVSKIRNLFIFTNTFDDFILSIQLDRS